MKVTVLFPNVATGGQVSHVCFSFYGNFPERSEAHIHCHSLEKGFRSPVAYPAVPPALNRIAWRIEKMHPFVHARTVDRFLRDAGVREGVAILWPGAVVEAAKALRAQGCEIVMEMINCHQGTARRILIDAYTRAGMSVEHGIAEHSVAREAEVYAIADAIFSPSPMTRLSLLENGVPEEKILDTAFGWSPEHNRVLVKGVPKADAFTAIFAGTVCVRKGAHLLAAAWRDAGIREGRLLFAGAITGDFADKRASLLTGDGISCLGHRSDLPNLLAASHVFAFPTLEEGGPIVTYEAAAAGLAILTTPMGAGAVIRNGVDGIVLDPFDHDGWVQALRTLASDASLRARLGEAARQRAREFTFEKTALQRCKALEQRFGA